MDTKQYKTHKYISIEGSDCYLEKDLQSKKYNLKEVCLPKGKIERVVMNCKNWGDISDKEFENLCFELEECNSRCIQFSIRNTTQITDESMHHLHQAISLNQSCTEIILDFEQCESLTNNALERISQGLSINESIQRIQISFRYCQQLTDEGVFYLTQALKRKYKTYTHIHLNFEYCFSISDNSLAYLCDSLKTNQSCQELSFNFNSCSISNCGLLAISETVMTCTSINYLTLKLELCEQISDIGLASLSKCLSNKTNLTEFKIFFNSNLQITNKGIKMLLSSFNTLQNNFRSIVISLENIPNITGKLLKYIQNIIIVNDKKINNFTLNVKKCSSFNNMVFSQLQELFQSKQSSIEELILDFSCQNFLQQSASSFECYRKILDKGITSQIKIILMLGDSKQFNLNDNQHIQQTLKQMNLSNKIALNYSDFENQTSLNNSIAIYNNNRQDISHRTLPQRDLSCFLQFAENKERKELQVSLLKWHHTHLKQNDQGDVLRVVFNLERCNSLSIFKDLDYCLKQSYFDFRKLDIEIIRNEENQEIFEASIGINDIEMPNKQKETKLDNPLELDYISFTNLFSSIISSKVYTDLNIKVQFALLSDKVLENIGNTMKQNKAIQNWSFSFAECVQLSDQAFRQYINDIDSISSKINSFKLNLEECYNISDSSIQKLIEFVQNNQITQHIEFIFKKANQITDKSLQDLLEAVENDTVSNRQFQIRFISCPKLSLKQMVKLDKAIKKKNGEI